MGSRRFFIRLSGTGFVFLILGINALLMGTTALNFSQGPYSSHEQELWYRYGSVGFLLTGVALPGVAVGFGALRARWTIVGLVVWMIVMLMAFLAYALLSGGGI